MTDQNDEVKTKKPHLKVKSISSMESAKKKKLLIWAVVIVVFLLFAAQALVKSGRDKPQAVIEPTFTDTTPTPTSQEQLTITGLQQQLAVLTQQIKALQDANQKSQDALSQKLDQQQVAMEKQRKALQNQIKDAQAKINEKATSTAPAVGKDQNGNPYLMPPLPQDAGPAVVPPPNITPGQNQEQALATPGSAPTPTQWTNLPAPTILSGGEQSDGGNVLAGAKTAETEKKAAGSFLPMGSWADVVLLTGADFGAGQGTASNPQPALLRLTDNAVLPNDARYKLRHCAAIGSGYGDLSSERVYMSITRLSCVDAKSGRVLETPIVGFVADSDGKLGMRGKLVNREGAVLAKAMLAGFAQGASQLLSQQAQNLQSTVTGAGVVQTMDTKNLGEASGYAGAGKAMDMLAQRYLDEAQAIYPVIEVDSGRKATIVIQNGQFLKWREPGQEKQK